MKPDVVDLGVDAVHHARAFAYESRPIAQEYRLLALLDTLRMDLGDEARQPHTRQQLGVDIVTLVVGLGDDSKPLGMGEHEVGSRYRSWSRSKSHGQAGLVSTTTSRG